MKRLPLLGVLLFSGAPALAQSNSEVNAGIQFDFSLPGARSLGLGGAFVSVANDATAAWSNPAGLTILTRPELSGELRAWNFNNFVTHSGHAFGPASGVGADTVTGLQDKTHTDSSFSPSFLSFVYPRNRWALALYRHQVSKFEANVVSEGPFLDSGNDIDRVDPFRAAMTLDISDYGVSVAYRLTNKLSIGVTGALFDFSLDSLTRRALYSPLGPPPVSQRGRFTAPGQRFGPADLSDANILSDVTERGNDHAWGFSGGFLWRGAKWSLGGAFRKGPDFKYEARTVIGPARSRDPDTAAFFREGQVLDVEEVDFHVPDVYGLGLAFRPTDRLLLTAQWDRAQYSQLSEDTAEVFGIEENNPTDGPRIGRVIREGLRFPDVNQFRIGTQYEFVGRNRTVVVRFGSWFDPDHRMRFDSEESGFGRLEVLFRPGDDEWHFAPGLGVILPKVRIDFALDFSERINTFALSTVYEF